MRLSRRDRWTSPATMREAFDDSGLTDAGFTDQTGLFSAAGK